MGKGSRNREIRISENQGNSSSEVKLSKKQLIRMQEKKARIKKYVTMAAVLVIAVSLVVAIVATSLAKTPKLEGVIAATSEKYEIDNAMIAYLLYNQYTSFINENYYILSYYQLDTAKSLKSQKVAGTDQTWFAYFLSMVQLQLNELVALATEAEEKGYSLDEDEIAAIDDEMKELKEYANKQGYISLDRYLATVYVNGVTAKSVRTIRELQALATKYYTDLLKTFEYTDEEIEKFVEDNPSSFYMFDYVYYTFKAEYASNATAAEKKEALAEAKKKAEEFLAKASDPKAFRNLIVEMEKAIEEAKKETDTAVVTSTPESGSTEKTDEDYLKSFTKTEALYVEDDDFFEWAFKDERKAGDTTLIEDDEKYTVTVYLLDAPKYLDEAITKDVRHILFSLNEYSDADAKAKAEEILAQYKAGEMTAEAFGELAKEYSYDGNAKDGGLYENVLEGVMVTEFNDWLFHKDRKTGDVDIVKTQHGYHIMYYVGDGNIAWKVNAENGLKNEEYTDYLEELEKKYPVTYDYEKIANIP
ncbi:MAG: hypothetical protein E7618_04800 [Ruminococcaceae bacterium]|nr:hypothetical protein [Oscillospiraceae bacterium]